MASGFWEGTERGLDSTNHPPVLWMGGIISQGFMADTWYWRRSKGSRYFLGLDSLMGRSVLSVQGQWLGWDSCFYKSYRHVQQKVLT